MGHLPGGGEGIRRRNRGQDESWIWVIINPVFMIIAVPVGGYAGWVVGDEIFDSPATILDEYFINVPAAGLGAYLATLFVGRMLDSRYE